MRKYLAALLAALLSTQALGAVVYQKSVSITGTISFTSISYTPNAAADQFICPILVQNPGGSANITASASLSTFSVTNIGSNANVYDAAGTPNAYALWGTQSLNGSAETYTVSTPTTYTGIAICTETSGGVSVKATSSVANPSVGMGGTISGTAGTVATADILFWEVYDYSSSFDTVSTCGGSSTTVGSFGPYLICYQQGTGSSMTPTATAVVAANYYMVQWVESATGGSSAVPGILFSNGSPVLSNGHPVLSN